MTMDTLPRRSLEEGTERVERTKGSLAAMTLSEGPELPVPC